METLPQKYEIDKSNEEELDELREDDIQYVDINGNKLPEIVPRSAEELSVGLEPVNMSALCKLVNLKKAKMISQIHNDKMPVEITGNDKTGVIGDESFKEELIKANDELSGISDIILTEYNKPFELSGQTNNN